MEVTLENVGDLGESGARGGGGGGGGMSASGMGGLFSIGVLRLPESTFGLDEHRARLVDTGAVCGGATLPGAIPESTAYLSSGDIISAGSLASSSASVTALTATTAESVGGGGREMEDEEASRDHENDTPQNPSGENPSFDTIN
jgi:hypothetical protein